MTVHSSQGLTIKEPFCIHNPHRMYDQDKAILYTAITRGTTLKDIHFKITKAPNKKTKIDTFASKFKSKHDNYTPVN